MPNTPNLKADGQQQPPRQRTSWKELAALFAFVVVMAAGSFLFQQVAAIQQTQRDGEQRTYQTRAITCDMTKGIGVSEPKGCDAPEVTQYRDPTVTPASSASSRASDNLRKLMCVVLAGADDPMTKQAYADACSGT